jgi:hypothetical protein
VPQFPQELAHRKRDRVAVVALHFQNKLPQQAFVQAGGNRFLKPQFVVSASIAAGPLPGLACFDARRVAQQW